MHRGLRPWGRCALVALAALGPSACGETPVDPALANAELVIVQGDGQFAPTGEPLSFPFVVAARDVGDQEPVPDVVVEWTVIDGSGAELDDRVGVTDAEGLVRTQLRLGSQEGTYRVRARLVDADAVAPVVFEAEAVAAPALTDVPETVTAGETVELRGDRFSPEPDRNVVLFDGVRGVVSSATTAALQVRVPSCLPTGPVRVEVGFGSVRSNALETRVQGTDPGATLEVGSQVVLDATDGTDCIALGPDGQPGRYLLVVQSSAPVAGARFPVGVRGRSDAPVAASLRSGRSPGNDRAPGPDAGWFGEADPQTAWDVSLRERERRLVEDYEGARGPTHVRSPDEPAPATVPPIVGDVRRFKVLGRGSEVTEVQARARVVGSRAAFFVDERASAQVTDGQLRTLSGLFDDPIHGLVTQAYGGESDIDGNERVIILLTPEVNALTSRGEDGFVAGFFFGADLLPELEISNRGEIFYMVVPDPTGQYSDPRPTSTVLSNIPPVLAHEFQHMVHFNQRVLVREGAGTDALWLSEGLATMAEDLVALDRPLDSGSAFQQANLGRAVRFLNDPDAISLTVTAGSGTLAERGAGWLFVRHLWEHHGQDEVLARLTRTTRTGIENVEAVTGEPWQDQFADWAVALQAEFNGAEARMPPRQRFPRLHLRSLLAQGPIQNEIHAPGSVAGPTFDTSTSVLAGGTVFYEVVTAGDRAMALNIGAPEGGPLEANSRVRLTVVRLP